MRYLRFSFFFGIIQFVSCTILFAQGRFEIAGAIANKYNDAAITISGSFQSNYTVIETTVKQGKFYLKGSIDEKYKPISLSVKNADSVSRIHFFITNTQMKIKIDNISNIDSLNIISYSNVPFIHIQKAYEYFVKHTEDSIRFLYNFKRLAQNSSNRVSDSINSVYKKEKSNLLKKQIEFIKTHYNSYFSLYLFKRYILETTLLNANDLYSIYSKFNDSLKLTPEGKRIQLSLKKKKGLSINNLMPDFSFKTSFNEKYTLSQFRGKQYVLLCFWASWCKPCIKNIPMLNDINNNFSSKGLQLISISIDNNKNNWLSTLQKLKMPWLQSCDIKEFIEKKVRVLYDINWIPQYFLIDKNGSLIYQNFLSYDHDSYSVLKKMLNTCMP